MALQSATASAAPEASPPTGATKGAARPAEAQQPPVGGLEYFSKEPADTTLKWENHFTSLLLSADWLNTSLELAFLAGVTACALLLPPAAVDVDGSMPMRELAAFLWTTSLMRRFYNAYLEAVYFTFPSRRIQPISEHRLKKKADLCGREQAELDALVFHDRMTFLTQSAAVLFFYFSLPGFYPNTDGASRPMHIRLLRLIAHHYLLSFGMYWAHRSLHVVKPLWTHIHSIHHWAKHPLSRNTYQDHWFDNFFNLIIGEAAAQVLIPLDGSFFWFSRLFRIMESLEKHAGISGKTNIAYSAQQLFPFAQMPHHHDFHHEGHKGCNYTFSAVGGLWDCLFGTRKTGRAGEKPQEDARTPYDAKQIREKSNKVSTLLDAPHACLSPVVGVLVVAAMRLHAAGYVINP